MGKKEIELMPCPACGGTEMRIFDRLPYDGHKDLVYYVVCLDCRMKGPETSSSNSAARAWNDLPRALVWSSENPTQEGWYILRKKESDKPIPEFCMHFHHTKNGFKHCFAFFDDEEINAKQGATVKDYGRKFFFYGPIQPPKEC